MMENKLDKLFRDQLSKHEETPSSHAWEQIHENLKSRKRGLWMRRLSIAASIVLIAAAGFVGYFILNSVNDSSEIARATHQIEETEIAPREFEAQNQVDANEKEVTIENDQIQTAQVQETDTESVDEQAVQVKIEEPAENVEVIPEGTEMEIVPEGNEPVEEVLASSSMEVGDNEEEVISEALALNNAEEVTQEEKSFESKPIESQKKSFPKVQIVYKANEDSELVTSGKRKILNKGINKLTEFSEEHILTADRKTKLRNTKDDLLALNFGKLLNKSNKDVEN